MEPKDIINHLIQNDFKTFLNNLTLEDLKDFKVFGVNWFGDNNKLEHRNCDR